MELRSTIYQVRSIFELKVSGVNNFPLSYRPEGDIFLKEGEKHCVLNSMN